MAQAAFHSYSTRIISFVRRTCCAGVLATVIPGSASETAIVQFAPPESWVKPHFFSQQFSTNLEADTDQRVLLRERQINAAENETFVHSVRQILTMDGVQNGSTLTIDFNPSYQTVIWHWARIWRDGQHLDRLETNQVKIVQPEQELNQYILDGQKSAILVLEDVRVGDIIDYAYSIKGENPVFGEHFSAEIPVQLEQPAERLLTRVLWPKQRQLYAKTHECSVKPAAVADKDVIEYVWDLRQVPPITVEDSLPAWCDPQSWVQLSDFRTWAEVNQWALALFEVASPLSPELSQKIAEWKSIPDREQQVLSVLRFVQDQVRYFGIEIGASAERPADPSVVFARRYGDCKDKSLLFVTILRALGIEAYPVLVNASLGRGIENWEPSADAFDHCIAVVQCDGQTYWLDPTMNYQGGPLAAHYLPSYGCGLVISSKTTGLTAIPRSNDSARTTTTEYFQIGKYGEPSKLKVVTVAEGGDADRLRELFATTKRGDIEKNYTHFYSISYPGIEMSAPIAVEDDVEQNRFQTTEFYSIDKIWERPDKDSAYRCEFYPSSIATLLDPPLDTARKFPLGINFPEHQIFRTEVTLPEAWPSDLERKTVTDSAFTFQKYFRCAGDRLVMEYEYQSQSDSVSPADFNQYIRRLDQCSQSLGYTLIWR